MQSAYRKNSHRQGGSIWGHLAFLISVVFLSLLAVPASATTLERVKSTGKLVLGYRTDARPFSFGDGSAPPMGYSIALCEKIADAVKADLNMPQLTVEWVPVTPDDRFEAIVQGKIDLLCGSATVTLDRRKLVSFSIPIDPAGIAAMLSASAPSALQDVLLGKPPSGPIWRGSPAQILESKTFAVVNDTRAETWLQDRLKDFQLTATVLPVDSYEAGLQSLLDGTSQVFFGDRPILAEVAAASQNASNVIILGRLFTSDPIALALARDNDDFRLIVDRTLSQIYPTKEFRELYTKWFGEPDEGVITFFRQAALPE